jgi:hydroxymethylpyrimidine pyrophosphatase-like HAD family hydrolase
MDIIVDIDETLTDSTHRQRFLTKNKHTRQKFYELMDKDLPIYPTIFLVRSLFKNHTILLVTGRPKRFKNKTVDQMYRFGVNYHKLYMREDDDFRSNADYKESVITKIKNDGFLPTLAIDDNPKTIAMYKQKKILSLKVER